MATTEAITGTSNNEIHQLFQNIKTQKAIITKCTNLYKTLTSHFSTLQNSIDFKTLTLAIKLQSMDSSFQQSLADLDKRENAIPDSFASLSSEVEAKKQSAIDEFQKRLNTSAPFEEVMKSLCRRMDHEGLIKFVIRKKKEAAVLKDYIGDALKECVDPARIVLDTVKVFVEAKTTANQVVDKRLACGVIVTGLFPPEELKAKSKRVEFSRQTVAEANAVLRDWKEISEKGGEGGGDGESRMGSAEAAMFLQVVVGFGLTEICEEEFYERVGLDFSARRDMPKLAIPIFGDKLPDFIDQLIKNGKEVEAVYFAIESGLTKRFQPVSLLNSYLHNLKKNTAEILKKEDDAGATEEANKFEMACTRSILKCVEDNKLETEFPVDSLRKRLRMLEKEKNDKKSLAGNSKPSSKRSHSTGGPRSGGGPAPQPKRPRYASYSKQEVVPSVISSVPRYPGPYSLSGQTAYDQALTASNYGQRYGASLVPSVDQITQQYYAVSGGSAPSPNVGAGLSSYVVPGGSVQNPSAAPQVDSYGLQSAYGVYDYGATTTTPTYHLSYQPPPYAP